jgi:hypothetical protein
MTFFINILFLFSALWANIKLIDYMYDKIKNTSPIFSTRIIS